MNAYMSDPSICEFFSYERGAFSANLDDDSCGWIQGDPPPPSMGAFDEQARADLTKLKDAFQERGIPISFVALRRGSDGNIARGTFHADGCVSYEYEPGWASLPEAEKGETVTAIDANWWKSDICP